MHRWCCSSNRRRVHNCRCNKNVSLICCCCCLLGHYYRFLVAIFAVVCVAFCLELWLVSVDVSVCVGRRWGIKSICNPAFADGLSKAAISLVDFVLNRLLHRGDGRKIADVGLYGQVTDLKLQLAICFQLRGTFDAPNFSRFSTSESDLFCCIAHSLWMWL